MSNLHRVITNTLTKKQIVIPKPNHIEVPIFEDSLLITETDTKGIITYANRRFCKISGYSREELIGMPHSITRHPDMPVGLFHAMWKIISERKIWRGYVKSLAKGGKYYWTLMYVQVKLDEHDNVIGYTATRRRAYETSIKEAEEKYNELQGKEHINDTYFMRAELFHGDGIATRR